MARGIRLPARDGALPKLGDPPTEFGPRLLKWLQDQTNNIRDRVSGLLTIGPRVDRGWSGNFDGQWFKLNIPAGGGQFIIPHGLGRIPMGFTVKFITAPIVLYAPADDTAVWNENFITLVADAALANPAIAWVVVE